jgi:hypothetical protein
MARHASIPVWAAPNNRDWKSVVMAKAARGDFDPAQRARRTAERSSLIKLAHNALRVHVASLAGNVCPRNDAGGSEPLALAATALATALRNQQENSR